MQIIILFANNKQYLRNQNHLSELGEPKGGFGGIRITLYFTFKEYCCDCLIIDKYNYKNFWLKILALINKQSTINPSFGVGGEEPLILYIIHSFNCCEYHFPVSFVLCHNRKFILLLYWVGLRCQLSVSSTSTKEAQQWKKNFLTTQLAIINAWGISFIVPIKKWTENT